MIQSYFDKDQLNLLPKPIIETKLLNQIKNNRELPLFGYKQSMNMLSGQINYKTVGDGKTTKTLKDIWAFRDIMNQTYVSNTMEVVNNQIRLSHNDFYSQLRKLSSKLSKY